MTTLLKTEQNEDEIIREEKRMNETVLSFIYKWITR